VVVPAAPQKVIFMVVGDSSGSAVRWQVGNDCADVYS
jgi:hypothetical protein